MKLRNVLIFTAALFSSQAQIAFACEKLNSYNTDELKEYRDMLRKPDADPFDRLFAFEKLVCSDNPNLRNYAIKQGLISSADPLVRNQVLLKAMMQKERVDVELYINDKLTKLDKEFISKNSAIYSHIVAYRSEEDGCVGIKLNYKSCAPEFSIFVAGDKLEYNYGSVFGEFRLSQTGELVGYLRAQDSREYSRIPAAIKLF